MTGRRLLIVLAVLAGVVALVHMPPHPATLVTASCCPHRTTSEVLRSQWLFGLGMTFLTTTLCVLLAIVARRGASRVAIWVGAAAAVMSGFFASDLALSAHVGSLALSFNLALIAVAAFVTSLVTYARVRRIPYR